MTVSFPRQKLRNHEKSHRNQVKMMNQTPNFPVGNFLQKHNGDILP